MGGEGADGVTYAHDPEWTDFPEVGEAIKTAGAEENCYTIATHPEMGIWAVGIGGGWKTRETACKLALSVAVARACADFDAVAANYPDFAALCSTVGIVSSGGAPPAKIRRA